MQRRVESMKKQETPISKISAPSLLKNYCVIISSIVVILAGLHAARSVLGPFLMAIFFAVLLISPVNWLKKRGLASWLSFSVVILGVLLVGGGAATIVGSQIAQFARDIPEYRHRFNTMLESYNLDLGDVIPFLKETPPGTSADAPEREKDGEGQETDGKTGAPEGSENEKEAERASSESKESVSNRLVPSAAEPSAVEEQSAQTATAPVAAKVDEKIAAIEPVEFDSVVVETEGVADSASELEAIDDANAPAPAPTTEDVENDPTLRKPTALDAQDSRLLPKAPPEILKDGSLFSDDSNPAFGENFDPYDDIDVGAFGGKGQAISAMKLSSQQLFRFLGGLAGELSYFASTALIITLLLVFMLIETAKIPKKLAAAFGQREFSDKRVLGVIADIRHYMVIKTEMSLLVGVLVTILMLVSKVQYPLLWGFVAFLLNYIPSIGSVVAAIPPIVLATVEHGFAVGCADAIAFVLINCVVGYVVEPKLLGQGLDLSPLIVLIALIFFGWLLGPVGMFLSPPLAVVMKIIFSSFPETRWIASLMANTALQPSENAESES